MSFLVTVGRRRDPFSFCDYVKSSVDVSAGDEIVIVKDIAGQTYSATVLKSRCEIKVGNRIGIFSNAEDRPIRVILADAPGTHKSATVALTSDKVSWKKI
jgi:hypothetical protein